MNTTGRLGNGLLSMVSPSGYVLVATVVLSNGDNIMARAIVTVRSVAYDHIAKSVQLKEGEATYHLYCFERKVKPRLIAPGNTESYSHSLAVVPNDQVLGMVCDECGKPFVKMGVIECH